MKIYKAIVDTACKFLEILAGCMLLAMLAILFYHVVMRYFFNNALSWSEEICRQLTICFSFISMLLGVQGKVHIALEYFVNKLPRKAIVVIEVLNKSLIALFGVAMGYFSVPYVTQLKRNLLPATGLSVSYQYLIPTVIGILIFFVSLEQVVLQVRLRQTDEEMRMGRSQNGEAAL